MWIVRFVSNEGKLETLQLSDVEYDNEKQLVRHIKKQYKGATQIRCTYQA